MITRFEAFLNDKFVAWVRTDTVSIDLDRDIGYATIESKMEDGKILTLRVSLDNIPAYSFVEED